MPLRARRLAALQRNVEGQGTSGVGQPTPVRSASGGAFNSVQPTPALPPILTVGGESHDRRRGSPDTVRHAAPQRNVEVGQDLPPEDADDQTACANFVQRPPRLQGEDCCAAVRSSPLSEMDARCYKGNTECPAVHR